MLQLALWRRRFGPGFGALLVRWLGGWAMGTVSGLLSWPSWPPAGSTGDKIVNFKIVEPKKELNFYILPILLALLRYT